MCTKIVTRHYPQSPGAQVCKTAQGQTLQTTYFKMLDCGAWSIAQLLEDMPRTYEALAFLSGDT